MLAYRFRSVLAFTRALVISLLLGIWLAPAVQAQSGDAKSTALGIPTQVESSKTYTVSIKPDNSTTFTVQAQPRVSTSQAVEALPARQIPPPDDPDPPAPYNYANALGQSVPTQMVAGRSYTVSVTMYNSGTTTWSRAEDYTLMSYEPFNGWSWGPSRVPLPVDYVAPGQSVTFTFEVRAPETPGTHTFQWGMQRERYGSFGTTAPVVNVNVVPPTNNAQPAGQSAPTRMVAGWGYNVSVTMYNNGATTWSRALDYTLMSYAPMNGWVWGTSRVPLPSEGIAPGQTATFTFEVRAPETPGTYTFQWGMQREQYGAFGPPTEPLTINVVLPASSLGNVTFIHTDGLGSPVARTDGAGNLISRTYYEPYGNTAAGAQPTIGFTGHVNDVDTGLTYMQQRYYDPAAGRFLSIDPVTVEMASGSSFNRYVYANNNPFSYIDPDGRAVESVRIDKNNNVFIVIGITYKNISQERAAQLNSAIVSKWNGSTGKYTLHTTIVPGSQAKFGNTVNVAIGEGRSEGTNGGRLFKLYTKEANGASMEAAIQHEVGHMIGMNGWPVDKYFSNAKPFPGWEANIMAMPGGMVEDVNVNDILHYSRPYLQSDKKASGPGSNPHGSNSNTGPGGCMAAGGDCWH